MVKSFMQIHWMTKLQIVINRQIISEDTLILVHILMMKMLINN